MWLNIVGVVLLFVVFVTLLPQIIMLVRVKDSSGVSLSMHLAFVFSWLGWLVYSLHVGELVLSLGNSVGFIMEVLTFALALKYRMNGYTGWFNVVAGEYQHVWIMLGFVIVGMVGLFSMDVMVVCLGILDLFLLLPQVFEVFKVKDLGGISLLSWLLFVSEAVLWIVYAVGVGQPLSVLWAYLYLPLYFVIIWKVVRFRKIS